MQILDQVPKTIRKTQSIVGRCSAGKFRPGRVAKMGPKISEEMKKRNKKNYMAEYYPKNREKMKENFKKWKAKFPEK